MLRRNSIMCSIFDIRLRWHECSQSQVFTAVSTMNRIFSSKLIQIRNSIQPRVNWIGAPFRVQFSSKLVQYFHSRLCLCLLTLIFTLYIGNLLANIVLIKLPFFTCKFTIVQLYFTWCYEYFQQLFIHAFLIVSDLINYIVVNIFFHMSFLPNNIENNKTKL